MSEYAGAFAKGGCGCLIAFVVLALFVVMVGGSAHIDAGGAIILFVVGGILGLIILAIFNMGKRAADNQADDYDEFYKIDDTDEPF